MHFSEEFKTKKLRLPSAWNPKSSFFHTRTKSDFSGVDEDYNKTIAATNLSKEDDWGKRSGETLVDATLFNIRRERRCEFIGEGFRRGDRIEL